MSSTGLKTVFKMYCEEKLWPVWFLYIFQREPPLEFEVSLVCLEQWRPFHTTTAITELWRKCLPLCASHLFINQPAIRLSSGWVSPALLQGAVAAFRLSVHISFIFSPVLHHSPYFILANVFSPFCFLLLCFGCFSLCFLSLSSFTSVFLTELSLSLSLSVAKGSWWPCWYRYLKLWGPLGHQSWKSPFQPTVQPVGHKKKNISWETSV